MAITVTVHGGEPQEQQTVLDVMQATGLPGISYRSLSVASMEDHELKEAQNSIENTVDGPRFGTAKEFRDDAHRSADAILENIRDRSGIGNELESFMHDDETIDNLVDNVSAIIRVGMKVV